MDPRPTIPRSHHSDSTLTDTSHHSNVVIDIDYLHSHSAHSYYYNSFQRHSDGFSSPRLSICPTAAVSSPPPPPPASSSIYRKLDPEKYKSVTSLVQSCSHSCRSFRYRYRQFFAEFLGTFVMVILINGVSAEQILDVGSPKSWLTMSFGNGLAVLVAICISGHVSGAHLNPAVTLTFWMFSGFPRKKVPMYISAQLLGAFAGSAVLYTMVLPAIDALDNGQRQVLGPKGTAEIFATYPPLYAGTFTAVASEIIGTALLLLLIMVTGHPNNMPFCTMQGIMIAAGLMAISLGLGYTSGFSLNPARDLGPRVFTAMAGWGLEVFSAANYYAWIPSFAPIVGGMLGGLIYKVCIDPYDPPALS